MKYQNLIAAALAGCAILSACGRSTAQNQMSSVPSVSAQTPITVAVTNDHPQDVDVFVAQGGDRWRLGTVTTSQTQRFTVPEVATRAGTQVRLLIHPVGGGGDYSTGMVNVAPGQQLSVTVTPSLDQTSFSVSPQ